MSSIKKVFLLNLLIFNNSNTESLVFLISTLFLWCHDCFKKSEALHRSINKAIPY